MTDDAIRRLDDITYMHRKATHGPQCMACERAWPCPTYTIATDHTAIPEPRATLFGWPLDGSAGPPSDRLRDMAWQCIRDHQNGTSIRTAAELAALRIVIHWARPIQGIQYGDGNTQTNHF